MKWNEIESEIKSLYPTLQTETLTSGSASARWFFLPEGFKDIGKSLVFGFVEWGDELSTAELLEKLENLARKLNCVSVVGPLDFSTYLDYRLGIDHFELPSYPGEPSSKPKAIEVLKNSGFRILNTYLTHHVVLAGRPQIFALFYLYGKYLYWRTIKGRLTIVPATRDEVMKNLRLIHEMTHETFSENFLYMAVPFSVFEKKFRETYLPQFDETTSVAVYDKKTSELVGYGLCLKDKNDSDQFLFKTIGIKKGFRERGRLSFLILCAIYQQSRGVYKNFVACLMTEGNRPQKMSQDYGFLNRRYALFVKDLI
jgi:hypothetical protein